ncbi:hypothetical protein RDI58_013381 [Solanum bulbocastanum]|uniref:Uncharacterized protein n=2 Tax=Solanum TaxID=4107 RepID=A0AAN8YF62_SOLBU
MNVFPNSRNIETT